MKIAVPSLVRTLLLGAVLAQLPLASASAQGTCPLGCKNCVCNPEGTLIAGPGGDRPIESLVAGDLVYSVEAGRLVIVPLLRTQRVPVSHHQMVRLTFEDGRSIAASPLHPTADGRVFERLVPGDRVGGVRLTRVDVVPYAGAATYDVLAASTSGAFYAGGFLIGSTISPPPRASAPIAPTPAAR